MSCWFLFSVCKFKAHKRCAVKASANCKWTTLAAIGVEILEDEDGVGEFNNDKNHEKLHSMHQIKVPQFYTNYLKGDSNPNDKYV